MTKLVNRAKMTTASTGTGSPITLGSAVDGYQTFAAAGVADADVVRYVIEDGDAWEIGLGTYTASGTTLTRGSIESSNADNAINLTGNAVVYVSAAAADLQELVDFAGNFVLPTTDGSTGQVLTTNGAGTLSFTTITGYTDADVDTHLNTGTASSGEVLSWTGSDYDWVAVSSGATDINGLSDGYYSSQSLGLGVGAMVNNSGSFLGNTAVGYYAGNLTSTGNLNTFIGREAGDTNTTGRWNTFVGANTSGDSATTQDSVVVGYNSQATSNAIVVGSDAKALGSGQVSIGDEAGRSSNSSANDSVLIGRAAGQYVQGSRNIGIGPYSLFSFGTFSLTGTDNVALGYQSGYDLSTGGYNFLGGYKAGTNLTTGSNNVALGNGALDAATTGGENVAIGLDAGAGISTATRSVFIGSSAGSNASSGTGIGYRAARYSTAESNVAVGNEALSDTLLTGNTNSALGFQALRNVESGNGNTGVGYVAGSNITTGSNNLVLGNVAQASSATASNEITLGDGNITRFRIPGAGIDNTSAALSGTTPSVDVGARDTYTLTTSGNTTFTFTGAPSSGQVGTFSLIITAGGAHTLTWPASVDWAGGSAPDAPASGETDIYTFMTIDGGTTWYGFLAGDAMA